jgi:4-hydroxy-3-polyprenylbenzoate decarboxylase
LSKYIVGITGASGSIYGIRLIEELLKCGNEVHIIITDSGTKVMKFEAEYTIEQLIKHLEEFSTNIKIHCIDNLFAATASGSFKTDGMIIMPCSMATLGEIANGMSKNLLGRSADVCLKERRKLIVVPRETPFNTIHLKNMLSLSEAGAIILPAMPGFYHKPETIEDVIDFVVGKVMDNLGIENNLFRKWEEIK